LFGIQSFDVLPLPLVVEHRVLRYVGFHDDVQPVENG
jgi:hypothetical protein